ncbi:MAG: biotin/lipoyl-binding protein [Chitinophagales bacterium]|nr:biotin/lipoyl-binding protein [Chitinophagales bacterium]
MEYQIQFKEQAAKKVLLEDDKIIIDDTPLAIDMVQLHEKKYHALLNNQSYNIKVVAIDTQQKTISLKVNETVYELTVKNELDALLDKMGMSVHDSDKLDDIKAPMPGLVLDIFVEVGQEIQKGDKILVLEAMKMENILKADGSGIVKSILVKQKQAVEKNQLLIEIE